MLIVKILGSGCANCKKLEAVEHETAASAGLQTELVKVAEMKDIVPYDLLSTLGCSSMTGWSAAAAFRRRQMSGSGCKPEVNTPASLAWPRIGSGCSPGSAGGRWLLVCHDHLSNRVA